jgi:hypothetical protein
MGSLNFSINRHMEMVANKLESAIGVRCVCHASGQFQQHSHVIAKTGPQLSRNIRGADQVPVTGKDQVSLPTYL